MVIISLSQQGMMMTLLVIPVQYMSLLGHQMLNLGNGCKRYFTRKAYQVMYLVGVRAYMMVKWLLVLSREMFSFMAITLEKNVGKDK